MITLHKLGFGVPIWSILQERNNYNLVHFAESLWCLGVPQQPAADKRSLSSIVKAYSPSPWHNLNWPQWHFSAMSAWRPYDSNLNPNPKPGPCATCYAHAGLKPPPFGTHITLRLDIGRISVQSGFLAPSSLVLAFLWDTTTEQGWAMFPHFIQLLEFGQQT